MAKKFLTGGIDLDGQPLKNAKIEDAPAEAHDPVNKEYADEIGVYDTTLARTFENSMYALGAMPAGTNVKNKPIKDILDAALFPDLPPTFTEATITATGSQSAMVGYPITLSTIVTVTLNDRPSPILEFSASMDRNPEGTLNVLIPFTNTQANYTFPQTLAHKSLSAKVTAKVSPMVAKPSTHGTLIDPPSQYQSIKNIIANINVTALYPYFIKKYAKTDATLDPATLTYQDLMNLNVASIALQQFCESNGGVFTLNFAQNEGPYLLLVALYGDVNLNVKLGGSDDISSTFIKTLRTLQVPGMTGINPTYSIFMHDTGNVPFSAPTTYVMTR